MKLEKVEFLQQALTDPQIQLKHLEVDDYFKVIQLSKKLNAEIEIQRDVVTKLIEEYNKEFIEKTKSPEFKEAVKKKEAGTALTLKEEELLDIKPAVKAYQNGTVSGPIDFIDKIAKLREKDIKVVDLKFIKDKQIFKQVVENLSPDKQVTLFEHLLK